MEIFTIRNVKKNLFSWENQVSIYRQGQVETWPHLRGLLEASSPRNLEFSNKMPISHEIQQFHMIVRSKKCINTNFAFLEHFTWLCEIFAWSCEISFQFSLWVAVKFPSGPFHKTVRIFPMFMRNGKTYISTPFCHFSHFFLLNPPQPPSIKLQSLVQVHCLFLIIHIVYPPQFHFFFVTQCLKNHFKISPKLHKNH